MEENNRCLTFIMDGNFSSINGEIKSSHMHYKAFAGRYADYFSRINICARSFEKQEDSGLPVCGEKVEFINVPGYRGVKQLFKKILSITKIVNNVVKESDVLILRFPGNLSIVAYLCCLISNKSYAVEVVAEPRDYFSAGASSHPLRFFAKTVHVFFQKRAVKGASLVRYVTNEYLQKAYPSSSVSIGFSDVYLECKDRIILERNIEHLKIINVGMMHNHSKGHRELISSVAELVKRGVSIECILVGDGCNKYLYEKMCIDLGIENNVTFAGLVSPNSNVLSYLKTADIFVMPSYQEGMPRALLEAMSMGLPCISTRVGGIPEVLNDEVLIEPGSVEELSEKILHLFRDEQLRINQSKRNYEISLPYIYENSQSEYECLSRLMMKEL